MVLAATPNQASSGQRRAFGTVVIENDRVTLMQRPSYYRAGFNGPILLSKCFIAAATHDEEVSQVR